MRKALLALSLQFLASSFCAAAEEVNVAGIKQFMSIIAVAPIICETRACVDEEKARDLRMFKPLHASATAHPKLQAALEELYGAAIAQLDQLLPTHSDTKRTFEDRQEASKRRVSEAKSRVQTQLDLAQ